MRILSGMLRFRTVPVSGRGWGRCHPRRKFPNVLRYALISLSIDFSRFPAIERFSRNCTPCSAHGISISCVRHTWFAVLSILYSRERIFSPTSLDNDFLAFRTQRTCISSGRSGFLTDLTELAGIMPRIAKITTGCPAQTLCISCCNIV